MTTLGNSAAFWIYALIIGLGMAILFGGIVYYVVNKNKKRD